MADKPSHFGSDFVAKILANFSFLVGRNKVMSNNQFLDRTPPGRGISTKRQVRTSGMLQT